MFGTHTTALLYKVFAITIPASSFASDSMAEVYSPLKNASELMLKVKESSMNLDDALAGFPRFHHNKIPGHFQDISGHIFIFSRTQKYITNRIAKLKNHGFST